MSVPIIDNTDELSQIKEKIQDGGTYDRTADSNEAISEAIANIPTAAPSPNFTFEALADENIADGDIVVETSEGFVPLDALDKNDVTFVETISLGSNTDNPHFIRHLEGNLYLLVNDQANVIAQAFRVNPDGTITKGNTSDSGIAAWGDYDGAYISNYRSVVVGRNGASSRGEAMCVEVNPVSLEVSWGATAEFSEGENTNANAVCRVRDDILAVLYERVATDDGRLRAGTITPATLGIAYDTAVSAGSTGSFSGVHSAALDNVTDDIICGAYEDSGEGEDGYAIIATISGTTPTVGTPSEYVNADSNRTQIRSVDSTHVAIYYDNNKLIIGTYSGTTFSSWGTPKTVPNGASPGGFYSVTTETGTIIFLVSDTFPDQTFYTYAISGETITDISTTLLTGDYNDLPPPENNIVDFDGIGTFISLRFEAAVSYIDLYDLMIFDSTAILKNISGIADEAITAAATGTVIVSGIKEGGASGLDSRTSYYFDRGSNAIIKTAKNKTISTNRFDYEERIKVMDADVLIAIP